MPLSESIKAIETTCTRKPTWFYHAFTPDEYVYESVLTEGIKCRKLLPKAVRRNFEYMGHNGNHYISLSKMETVDDGYSAYLYYCDKPAFIISGDISPKKCTHTFEHHILESTRWSHRYSGFKDEYQVYNIVTTDNIIGIRASILAWYQEDYRRYLNKIKDIILYMKKHNINLPIYDYTRAINYNIHFINQDEYLNICDSLITNLRQKKLK